MNSQKKKRVVLFAFEGGTGIGHLRRIACIARALERHFACLVVTGHRAIADWFVSPEQGPAFLEEKLTPVFPLGVIKSV